MRTEKEIRDEIERLNKEHEAMMPKPKRCPTCGHMEPMFSTFTMYDSTRFNARMGMLYWVLGEKE